MVYKDEEGVAGGEKEVVDDGDVRSGPVVGSRRHQF